ncbi:MAG: hypothetical protein IKL35_06110 [Muribaculaceae bacterium]|nr:hypothetical protein [Muribaculaceae bacterium]
MIVSSELLSLCYMILAGIFQTVEFYVIAVLVAAMIVALVARPASRGEARQYLLAGELRAMGTYNPEIVLTAYDDGLVILTRHGIEGITSTGAVSIAVTVVGWDIVIEERLSAGYSDDAPMDTAVFKLDFLAPERYHIRYNSSATGRFVATPFHNRPGYTTTRQLIQ